MATLPSKPALKDFQNYVAEIERERGFTKENVVEKCLLLGEEVGELFKAVRKHHSAIHTDTTAKVDTVDEELADIFIYLCAIANKLDIDLEQAFLKKEEKNKQRTWK